MSGHSLLSPSSAHRWLECSASAVLQDDYPDDSSVHADDGTTAHMVASWLLYDHVNDPIIGIQRTLDACTHVGREWDRDKNNPNKIPRPITEEMAEHVNTYYKNVIDYLNALPSGSELLVERRLRLTEVYGLPVEENEFGTGDAVIISADGKEIQVHDLKYGMRFVSAVLNPQLMLYGLAALAEYEMYGAPFEFVRLVIHQPRVSSRPSEYVIDVEDLLKWKEEQVHKKVKTVMFLKKWKDQGVEILDLVKYMNPGEHQCQWCKHKPNCVALEKFVADSVADDFDEFGSEIPPSNLDAKRLAERLSRTNLVEIWVKAVRSEAFSRLRNSDAVPGWKLVEGRKGHRKWKDEAQASTALRIALEDRAFVKTLISPVVADKLIKKEKLDITLADLVTQPNGKISMVTEDDPRDAVSGVAGDFDTIDDEDEDDEF